MSIRDLSDSPFPRRHPPIPPTAATPEPPPSAYETPEYWAERFAEERRSRERQTDGGCAQETGSDDPRVYRVRSEDVWQAARAEYAAGFSAETVCAQFDLGLSAFRHRARREGWRRRDGEDALPAPLEHPPEPEAAPTTPELVDLAWRSAAQAIRRGRAYEARAWMRLWESLKAVARDERVAIRMAEMRAAREAEEAAAEEAELHPLHPEESVQSSAVDGAEGRPAETPPPLSADARSTTKALKDVQDLLAMMTEGRPP